MNRPATPSHLMARSEQWDALERRPRRDYGHDPGGQPVVSRKALADRDERYESMYSMGVLHDNAGHITERILSEAKQAVRDVVRERISSGGFNVEQHVERLRTAVPEAVREVIAPVEVVALEEEAEEA